MSHQAFESVSAADVLTERFYEFETRGRGTRLWDARVMLEPPFVPFAGHKLPTRFMFDDGRQSTILSSLADRVKAFIGNAAPTRTEPENFQPEPRYITELPRLVELQTALPADYEPNE